MLGTMELYGRNASVVYGFKKLQGQSVYSCGNYSSKRPACCNTCFLVYALTLLVSGSVLLEIEQEIPTVYSDEYILLKFMYQNQTIPTSEIRFFIDNGWLY
jgi:hypothetical protein